MPPPKEGVMLMLTCSELFQFCLVIIGIIVLFFQAKKEVTAPVPQLRGYFL